MFACDRFRVKFKIKNEREYFKISVVFFKQWSKIFNFPIRLFLILQVIEKRFSLYFKL